VIADFLVFDVALYSEDELHGA